MIVVDASALIELLLGTSNSGLVEERLFSGSETLHAPHLLDVEVAQVMRRYVLKGDCTAVRGREALDDLCAMPVERYAHDLFLSRIWALRDNLTAYDAAYVALAETLSCPLVTMDAKLAASPGNSANIELLLV